MRLATHQKHGNQANHLCTNNNNNGSQHTNNQNSSNNNLTNGGSIQQNANSNSGNSAIMPNLQMNFDFNAAGLDLANFCGSGKFYLNTIIIIVEMFY